MRQDAFTLVEIMIAVALLAILAGIGVPYLIVSLPTYRVNGATRQVLADFRLAETRAVDRGVDVLIQFEGPPDNRYTVVFDLDGDKQIDAAPTDEHIKVVDVPDLYRGIEFGSAHGDADADGINFALNVPGVGIIDNLAIFNPDGRSSTGSVFLRPTLDGSAGRTDRERRVTLVGPTARAKALQRDGANWE